MLSMDSYWWKIQLNIVNFQGNFCLGQIQFEIEGIIDFKNQVQGVPRQEQHKESTYFLN